MLIIPMPPTISETEAIEASRIDITSADSSCARPGIGLARHYSMKTLMATDGSSYATTALTTAGRLLTQRDNRFDVVCVVPEFHSGALSKKADREDAKQFRGEYYDYMEKNAGRLLKRASEALQAEGIAPHVFAKTGSPGDVLVRLGEDYDVVVVGAQSRAERPSPGLGPIASRIVEHVAGIALVGRELVNDSNFKILVGVDGSSKSRNALEALRTNFNLDGSQVTLMHVVEKPWLRLSLEQEWYAELQRAYGESPEEPEAEKLFASELRLEAEQIIEDARQRLEASEVSTEARIEEGIPGNELLHEAEIGGYDLVALGATGVSDLKHTMLGSVAFKLASYAPCSVAVVR
jgi:nucleotide-binding universal stress UspA family protein